MNNATNRLLCVDEGKYSYKEKSKEKKS